VLGIVGNTSIIVCAVNHGYYEQQGFYVVDSGIAPECYSTPNSAPVNMGPRYRLRLGSVRQVDLGRRRGGVHACSLGGRGA
jgi:hypothetical protein